MSMERAQLDCWRHIDDKQIYIYLLFHCTVYSITTPGTLGHVACADILGQKWAKDAVAWTIFSRR